MACVVRQRAYSSVLTVLMFFNTVNGVAQTTTSCGESIIGQPQTLTCDVNGVVTNNIYWYRYNGTYDEIIINCFKTSAGDVGTCVSPKPKLYNVSGGPQQPKQQVFTINSVTQEDLQVSWLCVDRTSFPDRASISADATCHVELETTTIIPITTTEETTTIPPTTTTEGGDRNYSLEGGVAFISDFVAGVVVFLVIICAINKDLSAPLMIVIFVIFAVVSGILGGGSYGASKNGVSIGGIVGINIGCMLVVFIITILVVKFACK